MAATATMATSGSARKRLLKEEDMTKVEFETSEEVDVTPTFDTMGLREDLLRGIYAYGEQCVGADEVAGVSPTEAGTRLEGKEARTRERRVECALDF
ncbi:eukaryotic initiation factor 4A-III-like [Sminthopsis crassicaudata]|uniref:eukaryotic initiation factor 4A-III-like n=1 Tax=Sminthopsis crassicaudata TaxID=9301 RepID=UPI003D69B92E